MISSTQTSFQQVEACIEDDILQLQKHAGIKKKILVLLTTVSSIGDLIVFFVFWTNGFFQSQPSFALLIIASLVASNVGISIVFYRMYQRVQQDIVERRKGIVEGVLVSKKSMNQQGYLLTLADGTSHMVSQADAEALSEQHVIRLEYGYLSRAFIRARTLN